MRSYQTLAAVAQISLADTEISAQQRTVNAKPQTLTSHICTMTTAAMHDIIEDWVRYATLPPNDKRPLKERFK